MKFIFSFFLFNLLCFGAIKAQNNYATADTTIYYVPDSLASFPGGQKALYTWIFDNQLFPLVAVKANLMGNVRVSFIVEKDGSISNEKITAGIGAGYDEAALNLLREMPKWNPAKNKNLNVRSIINMSIPYDLDIYYKRKAILEEQEKSLKICKRPTKEASFGNDSIQLDAWIKQQETYQELFTNGKLTGEIVVILTIETNGSISDPKIYKGIGMPVDKLILDMVKEMPNWNSAEKNGQKVRSRTQFSIPLI